MSDQKIGQDIILQAVFNCKLNCKFQLKSFCQELPNLIHQIRILIKLPALFHCSEK